MLKRNSGGLGQGDSSESGQNQLDLVYILSVDPTSFAFGPGVVCEKKEKGIKNDSIQKDGSALNLEGEDYGRVSFRV